MTDKIYGYESITKVTGEIKDDNFNPMIYKSKTKSSRQDRFENIIYKFQVKNRHHVETTSPTYFPTRRELLSNAKLDNN